MAKACTVATNFLNFCIADSGLDLALGAAGFEFVAGVGCGAGMGSMKTESGGAAGNGLLVALVVN